MTTIRIQSKGLDEVIRNLGSLNAKKIFKDAANRSIAEVQKFAMAEVPKRTHQLAQSHTLSPATTTSLSAEVYTQKEYAVPVHDGHEIVAWGHKTGRNQPANPWMQRAVDRAQPTIDKIFDQAADHIAREITK
jgi:hypothetical protein